MDTQFQKSVAVCLIVIDNYEEVKASMEDVRAPMLIAFIDRKINALAQDTDGIVQRFERDRFLVLFADDKLEQFKQNKFDILRQVREVDMGNKMPVTLSIGVGVSGNTLAENMGYARAAVDLALSRGGDQALIKDGENYLFFGGVSKEVNRSTRIRTRIKAHALVDLIDEASNIIVTGHKKTDLDCLGAAIGVYKIALSQGKRCNIVLNDVTLNIRLLHDRLMKQREYREEVFVTTSGARALLGKRTLLIIVDTHRPSLLEGGELLKSAKRVVIFDHHRKSAECVSNPVLSYHEPYASSASELITEMIQYINGVELSKVEADALLAGIMVDTKNFAFKTGAKTFETAAFLRRNGADSLRVKMLFQYDMEFYKNKADTVNSAEILDGGIAISVCPDTSENAGLTAAKAADDLLNITGILSSYVLCMEKGCVVISARSLGAANVQMIMEKMGGGGHQMVAGVQLSNMTIEDAVQELKRILMTEVQT